MTFLDGRIIGPRRRWIVCWEGNDIIVVDIATGNVSMVAEGREAIWLDDHALLVEA
jgi:hypothetical protein